LQRGQKAHHARLESLSAALTALDPSAVLARGYAMALTVDGHCVREARQLSRGDRLRLRFARGEAIARVESLDQELGHPPG
jgi:exodeoxyribonuclease VII large subunit